MYPIKFSMVSLTEPENKHWFTFSCVLWGTLASRKHSTNLCERVTKGSVGEWCDITGENVTSITSMLLGNGEARSILCSIKQLLKSHVLVINYSTTTIFPWWDIKINQEEYHGQDSTRRYGSRV